MDVLTASLRSACFHRCGHFVSNLLFIFMQLQPARERNALETHGNTGTAKSTEPRLYGRASGHRIYSIIR
ncbi:hypothetical protein DVQ41_04555 [Yersinia enterocolitica]|nr:hypothetical protein [Yersinia enterocolitica]QBP98656.1 hypothetical protein YEY1_07535 [Yersinia enterocolitica subsp. palearctica]EKN4926076.1 hypothetical protein [Yersinia enterocolitica]EKN4930137.1 hypothetical protein [Yersinia enterocolitica]EKN5012321.1 hypothetical protein [Yersinia enterocolitica]